MTDLKPTNVQAALRESGALALFLAMVSLVSRGLRRGWDSLLDPASWVGLLLAVLFVAGVAFTISLGIRSLLVHRPMKRTAEQEGQDVH